MTRHRYYNFLVNRTKNLGDRCASPLSYLQPTGEKYVFDIRDHLPRSHFRKGDVIIIGGGGMLHNFWIKQMTEMLKPPRPWTCVVWGAGHNRGLSQLDYPRWLEFADLVGVRDAHRVDHHWVPCASCLAPEFDVIRSQRPTCKYVLYEHCDHKLPFVTQQDRASLPWARNTTFSSLYSALYFLAQGEIVVTNSYHGAYWAALLNRPVLVYAWGSKFKQMPGEVDLLDPATDWHQIRICGSNNHGLLQECRIQNRLFWKEVKARAEANDA